MPSSATPGYDALTDDQRALCDLMSEVSEERWAAGWIIDNEYELWRDLDALPEGAELRWWSDLIGGWIAWGHARGGPVFVPMPAWRRMFDAWAARHGEPQ